MGNTIEWSEIVNILLPLGGVLAGAIIWAYKLVSSERQAREALGRDFAEFKERMLRETVTHSMLERLEGRIVETINRLGDRLDSLFEKKG